MNTTSTLNKHNVPAQHVTPEDFVRAVIRGCNYDSARAARLLGRQCARENWTFDFRLEVEAMLGDFGNLFYSTFDKFSTDSKVLVTVGTTDEQGFLNILQSGPTGEIYDNWIYPRQERLIAEGRMYATEKPWPLPAPKPAKRATETLTPRMTGYVPFNYCQSENCRAYCCK